jgi:hypothetical protein
VNLTVRGPKRPRPWNAESPADPGCRRRWNAAGLDRPAKRGIRAAARREKSPQVRLRPRGEQCNPVPGSRSVCNPPLTGPRDR